MTGLDIWGLLFAADSLWSVLFRAFIWLVVSVVIIVSLDNPNPDKSIKNMKSNLGFLFFFMLLSGTLIFLLFGYHTA